MAWLIESGSLHAAALASAKHPVNGFPIVAECLACGFYPREAEVRCFERIVAACLASCNPS